MLRERDLSDGGIGHVRSYQNGKDGDFDRGQGWNWNVDSWPTIQVSTYQSSDLAMIGNGRAVWFRENPDGTYETLHGRRSVLTHDPIAGEYTLTGPNGTRLRFHDLDHADRAGGFLSTTSPGGRVTEVTDESGGDVRAIRRSDTTGGVTTTDELLYEYADAGPNFGQLLAVTSRRQVDAGPWKLISRAEYAYYGVGEDHGSLNDLKTVERFDHDGTAWQSLGLQYYRYWKTNAGAGLEHGLQYVLKTGSYDRLAAAVADPLTASNAVVAQYADHYFEYDGRRASKETVSGGSRTMTFAYHDNPTYFTAEPIAFNVWLRRTTETRSDGSQVVLYCNSSGQTMLRVEKDGADEWVRYNRFDDDGRVILKASPSAVSDYDELLDDLVGFNESTGAATHLRAADGLVSVTNYYAAPDAAAGLMQSSAVKRGTGGTPQLQQAMEYTSHTADGRTVRPVSKQTVYRGEDGADPVSTTHAYTFHPGTVQVASKTTTLPVVPTSEGGTGVAETTEAIFDANGFSTWNKDARGVISRRVYDLTTGAIVQSIEDVDVSLVTDEPAGWATPAGGGKHLVTDYEHDDRGRVTQTLGPVHAALVAGSAIDVRTASWTLYKDADFETVSAAGYRRVSDDADVLINPVSITKRDRNGNVVEEISAKATVGGPPQASDSYAQSDYVAWTTHAYTDCCKLASTRVYHTIPTSGEGVAGTNYDETTFGYDLRDRRDRVDSPGGTISISLFDTLGRTVASYVGTDDAGATATDPTGGGALGNDMVLLSENQYDDGLDGGDGNLTRVTAFVDDATTRVTRYEYDWRNRQVAMLGEEDSYSSVEYDNLGRTILTERRFGNAAGRLLAKSEILFNDRGQTYETKSYPVDPVAGVAGTPLVSKSWFDAGGNLLKSQSAGSNLFTLAEYDSLGRATTQYVGYEVGQTGLGSVSTATVLTQSETAFDDAGNVLTSTVRDRYDDVTGSGPLAGPTGAGPNARVSYSATWYDPIGRTLAAADYGTNAGSVLARPATVPAAADDVLVSSIAYDDAGRTAATVAPDGMETATEYDDLGRRTAVIENVDAGSTVADANRTTRFSYTADGQLKTLTAENAATGDQVTTYEYGTTLAESEIASSSLLRKTLYPDSTGPSDSVIYEYDRTGALTAVTDQNGTTHLFDYDALGRRTADRVETLGTGVDGAVRRVETAYDDRGLPERMTCFDAPYGGFHVNEVTREHDEWNRLTAEFQEHAGPVGASTPSVGYAYEDGAANTLRPTSLTYPNGRVLAYGYGTTGSTDDVADRVAKLTWDGTIVEEIDRLGSGAVAELRLPEPDVSRLFKLGGTDPETGDQYGATDRFGRETQTRWRTGSSTDVVSQDLGYDRASSRTFRRDNAAAAYAVDRDELYGHDALRRLQTLARGDLNPAGDAVSSENYAQGWTLDETGNWSGYEEGPTSASPTLEQTRTGNAVNEITAIAETAGPSWADPAYDASGNMTTVPQPGDPTATYAAVYDAWNRLVKLTDGATVVQENAYDARGYRIERIADGEARRYYHSAGWRVLEERIGTATLAERQFVWGVRYIDELVLRDRDEDGTGSLIERLYALQDANWNVVALVDEVGGLAERFGYAAYGEMQVLTPAFAARTGSDFDWETTYAGYRREPVGTYHMRFRVLHPQLGCWLTRDPIGYTDGSLGLYEYVRSMPTQGVDPTGLRIVKGIIMTPPREGQVVWIWVPDTWSGGSDQDACNITKTESGLTPYAVKPTKDEAMLIKSSKGNPSVEKNLVKLLQAKDDAWVVDNIPSVLDSQCARWGTDFYTKLLLDPSFTMKTKVEAPRWPVPGGPEHMVILCKVGDDTYGVDSGFLGGEDKLFNPHDLPKDIPNEAAADMYKYVSDFEGSP
ncbi:hypothetical protein LzC2_22850 [Planctomycetes bacterium LzC2]|uniref:RHS repeat-associated core domain-containing protein n=1 Tax=Alienimonas chondri TaxID=2681879 RepID=A0ABX1VDT0_9PLAN|nr:hypothetical protein [Alienimonas chondri]